MSHTKHRRKIKITNKIVNTKPDTKLKKKNMKNFYFGKNLSKRKLNKKECKYYNEDRYCRKNIQKSSQSRI